VITVDVSKAVAGLSQKVKASDKAVNKALRDSALEMTDHIKDSITYHQSSGKTYGKHTASAPGFAPNGDLGNLASSTQMSRRIRNNTAEVIVGARYARRLEYGTRNMKPRPFVRPAREALQGGIERRIRKAMNRAT